MADDIIVEALKKELEKLRSEAAKSEPDISYSAMEASVKKIRDAVAGNACAWEDLAGITEENFALLELQCFHNQIGGVVRAHTVTRNRVKSLLHSLNSGAFNDNPAKAKIVFDIIRRAGAMGLLTWEEMGTTRKDLDEALEKITG